MSKKIYALYAVMVSAAVLMAGCSSGRSAADKAAGETAEVSVSESGSSGSNDGKTAYSLPSIVKPDISENPGSASSKYDPAQSSKPDSSGHSSRTLGSSADENSEPGSSAEESSEQGSSAEESSEYESSVEESSEPESSADESSEYESSSEESSEPESSFEESSEPESSLQESDDPQPSYSQSSSGSKEAESVNLSAHDLTLKIGEQYRMNYYYLPYDAESPDVTYYIKNPSVIYVSSDSVITALAEGEATLTLRTSSGLSDSCKVTVISEPSPEPSYTDPELSESSSDNDDGKPIVNAYLYYTSSAVYRDISLLRERYPDIIGSFNIGSSARGKPITCVTLGKGNKKSCIVAGIHAREHITISFTMRCIEEYAKAYKSGSYYGNYNIRELLDNYTLYIVPMINPDGTDISNAGESPLISTGYYDPDSYKLNANGVNLNRNFPYNWERQYTNWPYSAGEDKYPGKYAASESETQAIIDLCAENDFLWLLDMHIVGNGIYWRDEMNGAIPDDYAFANHIANNSGYMVFGMSTDVTVYSGGLENWFRCTYNRPALCIEMLPYSQSYYSATYRGFNSYFEDAINWYQSKYTYLAAMDFYG